MIECNRSLFPRRPMHCDMRSILQEWPFIKLSNQPILTSVGMEIPTIMASFVRDNDNGKPGQLIDLLPDYAYYDDATVLKIIRQADSGFKICAIISGTWIRSSLVVTTDGRVYDFDDANNGQSPLLELELPEPVIGIVNENVPIFRVKSGLLITIDEAYNVKYIHGDYERVMHFSWARDSPILGRALYMGIHGSGTQLLCGQDFSIIDQVPTNPHYPKIVSCDNQLVLSLSESGQARLVYGSISIELSTNEHTVSTNERMFICNGRIMHWSVNRLATVFVANCDTLFVVQVKVDQRTYTVASIPMVVNAITTQGFVVTSSGDAYKVNKPSLSKPIRQDNVTGIMKLVRTGCWVA
jgi:hypothetical protein